MAAVSENQNLVKQIAAQQAASAHGQVTTGATAGLLVAGPAALESVVTVV